MDDGLVLNLASNDAAGPASVSHAAKSGRWTDRVKAKRVAKRKTRTWEKTAVQKQGDSKEGDAQHPPVKRPRKDASRPNQSNDIPTPSEPPTQIISSLFSYNPKIETPLAAVNPKTSSKPSNAPLAGPSTFCDLGLDPLLAAHMTSKMNITKPTSIQRAVLPLLVKAPSEDTAARDVFIQSQTGSGKTLAFLLPIIQDLLPLSTHSYIDRSIGTLAIIIAPTRELAKQIADVLEALLTLKLHAEGESEDDQNSTRFTRWLVSGLLSGGATRTHEKARLRKGLPIIVSTPGRLLDHLQNTSSFNVGKCRWLVLDEADRLMELGFEETIKGIVQGLDGRRKLAIQAVKEGKSMEVGGWDWERRRRTILCSATIREDVQKLAGTTLIQPLMIKAMDTDKEETAGLRPESDAPGAVSSSEKFTPPTQLSQKYVVVPLKMRLVALVALLRLLLAQAHGRRGSKIIVFLSCTDSVDFHWNLLGGSAMGGDGVDSPDGDGDAAAAADNEGEDDDDSDIESKKPTKPQKEKIAATSPLLPDASIFRLHGSLPPPTRLASLRGFSSTPNSNSNSKLTSQPPAPPSSILLCTSVASRGLDLPLVRAVVQYDLPTEGGATEYVHRVGRTARAGKGGEAWSIVAPSESSWVPWVEGKMRGDVVADGPADAQANISLEGVAIDTVLSKGFGGKGVEYEGRATDVQLSFERWVLRESKNADSARRAFLSHMRAYATHPSNEKHIFHVRHLHIGHLAKAFALRDAPKTVTTAKNNVTTSTGGKKTRTKTRESANAAKTTKTTEGKPDAAARVKREKVGAKVHYREEGQVEGEAERRMQDVVRAQGRLTRKGGVMMSSGAGEFQIASGAALESLAQRR
ncbi:hypothetical protein SERLA73DRAFT_121965 [Serpula lacrymans var. lacrymans S7.3]|uniref:ATP-dependent RNA helicase n=1 Tax=Serpula lacrymans var. lacrymans (strain S7.3) TaxID=936435 RepID=F8PVZ5_SERL3|nr:hypothetical protein SERLA73DRAFT_121965 [Serpula lacrymans var. lacrymans S7.3]